MELILHYVVASDVFILHAARRHFWWWQNVLWAEEIPHHTTVVLSGADEVVPSAAVRDYLVPRGVRTVWLEGCSHAGFLFGGERFRTVVDTIHSALRYEPPVVLEYRAAPSPATAGTAASVTASSAPAASA